MKKNYINNYLNLFSNLNKENIKKFDDLVVKDIVFIDPFNNIKGLDNFKNIFYHMFDTVEEPKFLNNLFFEKDYFALILIFLNYDLSQLLSNYALSVT